MKPWRAYAGALLFFVTSVVVAGLLVLRLVREPLMGMRSWVITGAAALTAGYLYVCGKHLIQKGKRYRSGPGNEPRDTSGKPPNSS